jgi:adenylate cyclase
MKDPAVDEALRSIEAIVAQETGVTLAGSARQRLQQVLTLLGQPPARAMRENHLARDVTIVLADLRGFTSLSAAHPAGTVLDLLNTCFVRMSEIIFRHQGIIDKFMGDSILVLFDTAGEVDDSARRAIECAVDMQAAMEELNREHRQKGLPEMYFGIGINTGRVMSALLGGDLYSEYTVIGDEVNLASRIESFSLRGQVLISHSTFEHCAGFVKTGEPMDVFVKGKSDPVVLREVLEIPALSKVVPRQDERRSPRVEATLPATYRLVVNDAVIPQVHEGRVLDIGYYGVLLESAQPLARFSELVLAFELPLVGKRVADLYGKVVKTVTNGDTTWMGIEFSSMPKEMRADIQMFVQLLIQGAESRD